MAPEHALHEQDNHDQTLKPATTDSQPPSTPDLLPTSFSRDPSSLHLRAASGSSTRGDAQTQLSVQPPPSPPPPGADLQQWNSPASIDPSPNPHQTQLGSSTPIPAQLTGVSRDHNSIWENPWQTPPPAPRQHAMSTGGSSSGTVPQLQSNNPFRRAIEQRSSLQSVDGGSTPTTTTAWAAASDTPNPPAQASLAGGDDGTESSPLQQALTGSSYSHPHDTHTPSLPPKPSGVEPGQPEDIYDRSPQIEVGDQIARSTSNTSDLIDFGDEQPAPQIQTESQPEQIPERPPSYPNDTGHLQAQTTDAPPPRTPTPLTEAQIRQRERILAETYDIRKVNWDNGFSGLRESPMLVQNENGPCPLLALVNGMVMRARPDADSPLVKILQSKEKISVELLIHALFEELTTCVGENELPDIEDLGSFLTVLHTGMNVNPRLTAITHPENRPGTFLATRDTKLYSTFDIPLVHGWLAPPNSAVHAALVRAAEYHDDIQLLHFRKEELEHRISQGQSLSSEELQLVQDIETIQHFVKTNPTQLSEFGLENLNRCLQPGSISIFFRNEHFSTLFKHPHTGQLFTLVTDMGYANHAEVVWESLVDVNGHNAEFYSGDFRLVGHAPSSAPVPIPQPSQAQTNEQSHTEQSDADYAYALALQFQDEEEQRANRNQTQTQSQTTNRTNNHTVNRSTSSLPWRNRSSTNTGRRGSQHRTSPARQQQQTIRPLVTSAADDPDAPPPTYEQASKTPAYVPPQGHPQYSGPFDSSEAQLTGVTSASSAATGGASSSVAGPRSSSYGFADNNGNGHGRRPSAQQMPPARGGRYYGPAYGGGSGSGMPAGAGYPDRREKKDCVVM